MRSDRLQADPHRERLVRRAPVDTTGWRHVGVVAPDCDADVRLRLPAVVCRIERDPTALLIPDVDPRVRRRVITLERRVVEISAYVPRCDADVPAGGDH